MTVSPAAASHLLVSVSSNAISAGIATTVTITAEDQFNNIVTSFSDAVSFSDSLGGASFGNVNFHNGLATASATLDTDGSQTIIATDTPHASVTGTSSSVTVTGTAPPHFVITASPNTITAGGTTTLTIAVEDVLNEVVTGFSDSVTLSDSLGGASFGIVNFASGVATVTATLALAGAQVITATDTTNTSVTAGSSTIAVSAPQAHATGIQFRVNTFTTSNQQMPRVASDSAGDFVVVWQSQGEDGNGFGIYAQRYNSTGVAQGSEFRVNTYTAGNQEFPSVAMDSAGDFVVVWQSQGEDGDGYGIYAQRYNSSGMAQGGEFRVNTYTAGNQESPSVAMDSAGDFVIAWQSQEEDGDGYGIYAQRYNPTGITQGSEFLVNTYTTGTQESPSVAMDSSGDFVIAWQSYYEDGSLYGIYAQRYASTGSAQGSEFLVNTYTAGNQQSPSVAMDSVGDFVVAWQGYYEDDSGYGIFAQRYNSSGIATGSEFGVNTYTTSNQNLPSVAMDSAGDFVVAWQSAGQDGNSYGVYAQQYNPSDIPLGSEFRVNAYTSGSQALPSVAMDFSGDFVVAWQSNGQDGNGYGVYAQQFQPGPAPQAVKLVMSGAVSSLTAGHSITLTITAEDSSNNVVNGFSDTVTLSDSLGGMSVGTVTFTGGPATVTATLDRAGVQTIIASDVTSPSVTGSTSSPITVTPAAVAKLLISAPPATVAEGTAFSLTLTAADTFGNAVSGFADQVQLTDTVGSANFSSVNFSSSSGTATISAMLDRVGSQAILARDSTRITIAAATAGPVTVTPAAASHFLVSVSPTNLTAGNTATVVITAEDQFSDVVTGFSDTVALVDVLGGANFGAVSFTNGRSTVTASLDSAGADHHGRRSDGDVRQRQVEWCDRRGRRGHATGDHWRAGNCCQRHRLQRHRRG